MHVDFFQWDDEDFDRGNTRHILSAGYEPEEIERAIRAHLGEVILSRNSGRPMIDADIGGELTRIVYEIDQNGLVIVTPVTAFPLED